MIMNTKTFRTFLLQCLLLIGFYVDAAPRPPGGQQASTESTAVSQSASVEGGKASTSAIEEIKKMNFQQIMEGKDDKILIWRLEKKEAVVAEEKKLADFDKKKTYIILQGCSKVMKDFWNLFYWIGEESQLIEIGDTAAYTVLMNAEFRTKTEIYREVDGKESPQIKAIFEKDEIRRSPTAMDRYQKAKRMFLIEIVNHEIEFKEVQLSLKHAEKPSNCLVFSLENIIYACCGKDASDKQKRVAQELTRVLQRKRGKKVEEVLIFQSSNSYAGLQSDEKKKMTQLFRDFRNIPAEEIRQPLVAYPKEFREDEKRKILGKAFELPNEHEKFNTKVIKVFLKSRPREANVTQLDSVPLSTFSDQDLYIIDCRCNTGIFHNIFIWIGSQSQINLREYTARRAERYVKLEKYPRTTPIIYINQEDVPPEAKNVNDLTYLFRTDI